MAKPQIHLQGAVVKRGQHFWRFYVETNGQRRNADILYRKSYGKPDLLTREEAFERAKLELLGKER